MNAITKKGLRRSRASMRGMTLIELMFSLAVTMLFVSGVVLFLIGHTRTSRRTLDRADIQRGGRSALSLMTQEISNAGLGLPRVLAIRSFTTSGSECAGTPEIEIAALDYMREWTVLTPATSGFTLANAAPVPATGTDVAIAQNEWVFFYQNSSFTSGSVSNGFGLLRVSVTRAVGATAVFVDNASYSSLAPLMDLSQAVLSTSTPHTPVMLRTRESRFGVNCTADATHPYLFWQLAGQSEVPLARGADTRALTADDPSIGALAGARVALRFLFYVDANGDGQCDDKDGDGVLTRADALTTPAVADLANVCAIEVLVRLRSDEPEAGSNPAVYPTADFVELVQTTNINTRNPTYTFIDNSGL